MLDSSRALALPPRRGAALVACRTANAIHALLSSWRAKIPRGEGHMLSHVSHTPAPVPHQPSSVTTSGMMHYLAANASTVRHRASAAHSASACTHCPLGLLVPVLPTRSETRGFDDALHSLTSAPCAGRAAATRRSLLPLSFCLPAHFPQLTRRRRRTGASTLRRSRRRSPSPRGV